MTLRNGDSPSAQQANLLASPSSHSSSLESSIRSRNTQKVTVKWRTPSAKNIPIGNLREKIFGDVLVAVGVTFGVAPFMCVVDKAIVQHAAGTQSSIVTSALHSVSGIVRNPIGFVKSPVFLMMWSVYAATYATANSLKTFVEHQNYYNMKQVEKERVARRNENNLLSSPLGTTSVTKTDSSSGIGQFGIFAGTTLVNSATSLWKDRAYARIYGTSGVPSMPWITYGLWATRDCLVVGSSFILPDVMSKVLVQETQLEQKDAQRISQLVCPIATQFVVGPIQLLGLDFYNRPNLNTNSLMQGAMDRARFLARGFSSVVSARIARIAPAYAVGGVFNTQYRDLWRQRLIQKEIGKLQEQQPLKRTNSTEGNVTNLVGLVTGRYAEKN